MRTIQVDTQDVGREKIMTTLTGHFIDNRFLTCGSPSLRNINPATGDTISEVLRADNECIEQAIEAARRGFAVWSSYSGKKRGAILRKAAAVLRSRNAELALLEVDDTGKPLKEARSVDIHSGADALDYFGGIASSITGEFFDLGGDFAYTRREALGVCVGIGAWNYPLQIACWKAAPALACGNSMIFKPSPETPRTALELARALQEAGLPGGVFNVVQGDQSSGQALVNHPLVAKISLTGSVATGRKVMAAASPTLKQLTMELGGKSPFIVFADADLELASSAAVSANFFTQGEVCSNGTRVFVHRNVVEEFLEQLIAKTSRLIVGNPRDARTEIGALINKNHTEKVLKYIQSGIDEEAKLECGGKRCTTFGPANGNFVEPTIFSRCQDTMTIVKEEIFGPVMSLLSFTDEDEVVARANATPFGLAAGVFTSDLQRAHRLAAKLEAGICWLNTYNITPIEIPFGGSKQSGFGRENSHAAIAHYTQLKSVYVAM